MASVVDHRVNLPLLTAADPSPVVVTNPDGRSPFLFIGDHAGNVIPSQLGTMGLSDADRQRHIAWDIGVCGLGLLLAERMDATFVRQTYSRLVVDCNRRPEAEDAIPPVSDGTVVPANQNCAPAERHARFKEVHGFYHRFLADELDRRSAQGRKTIVIALHSFTPALMDGAARPWHIGVLHDGGNASFALRLLEVLGSQESLIVGDNEPYRMDSTDYTVPFHCYGRQLPYAELEIRQDLIASETGQNDWAKRVSESLEQVI